jgi:hypothetical protein
VPIPPDVIDALHGTPDLGTWEPVHVLITVKQSGIPDVCLLSRSECDATEQSLLAVTTSRRVKANLAHSAYATLIVHADAVLCLQLRRTSFLEVEPNVMGHQFELVDVHRDDIGVTVRPMTYEVTTRVAQLERWDRSESIMARMRRGPHADHTGF